MEELQNFFHALLLDFESTLVPFAVTSIRVNNVFLPLYNRQLDTLFQDL